MSGGSSLDLDVGGGGSRSLFAGIAGVGGLEVAVRTVPELVGLGDSVAVPALAVLVSKGALSWARIGWVLNWLLFWSLAVYYAPYLFPEELLETGNGLPARLVTAGGATGVGILLERVITEAVPFAHHTPARAPSAGLVAGLVAAIAAGFALVWILPPVTPGSDLLPTATGSRIAVDGSIGLSSFVVRATLFTLGVGVLLAEASMLYPFPEVYLIAVVAVWRLASYLDVDRPLFPRQDVAERLATGAVAAWGPLRHSVTTVYAAVAVMFGVLVAIYTHGELAVGPITDPVEALGTLLTAVAILVYTLRYGVSALERVAFRIARDGGDGALPVSRVPGFFLPIGAVVAATEQTLLGPALTAVAFGGVVLFTLAAAYSSHPTPVPLSDDVAVPLAATAGLAVATDGGNLGGATVSLLTGTGGLYPVVAAVGETALASLILLMPAILVWGIVYRRRHPDPEEGSVEAARRSLLTAFWWFSALTMAAVPPYLLAGEDSIIVTALGFGVIGTGLWTAGALLMHHRALHGGRILGGAVASLLDTPLWLGALFDRTWERVAARLSGV